MTKSFSINILVVLSILQFGKHQVESAINAHDMKCPIINKKYLEDVNVYFHSDETSNEFYASFTIVKQFPANSMGHVRALALSESGVYDQATKFHYDRNICEALTDRSGLFWHMIYARLSNNCPLQPGTYLIDRFNLIDDDHETHFRSSLDPQKYKVVLYLTHEDETIFYCHTYYDIE